MTPEEARRTARRQLARVREGADPSAERKTARHGVTVADLSERYMEQHALPKKRMSSVRMDAANIRLHVLPTLERKQISAVTRADISALHHAMRKTPGAANRVLSLLSKMFNLAEKWGMRPDGSNPCRHVEKYREKKRERYLSADELARLGDVLAEAERTATELPSVIAAVRLLILTGCRLSEILSLQWAHVDFAHSCLRLPDSKTGAKVVHLNAPALTILTALERDEGSPWVIIRGAKPGRHLVNLEKPWGRIRAKATLEDVRLHDLRHSFASVAVGLGEGLPMIGKLLGHTQTQTTARYAHLAADPVKAATERVGAALAGMMNGSAGQIVEMPQKRHD